MCVVWLVLCVWEYIMYQYSSNSINSALLFALSCVIVVDVWFQAAFLSVGEDVGELSLQLVSGGAYTVPFTLDVICSEVVPAEAKGGDFAVRCNQVTKV